VTAPAAVVSLVATTAAFATAALAELVTMPEKIAAGQADETHLQAS
jgi:hypothetical protein